MSQVISTVPAYLALAAAADDGCSEAAWVECYEARHPAIFESYYSAWGDRSARAAAAARVRTLAPLIPQREARARDLVERAEHVLRAEGFLDDADVAAVLLVGVGSSNGWTTRWHDIPTVFVALEMLPETPFDQVLVSHEMTHLAHERRRPSAWPGTIGTRLFAEGLAGVISRRVVPGLGTDGYLWFDGVHPDWVRNCADRSDQISAALLRDLDLPEAAGSRYFSAEPDLAGQLPERCGYWAGLQAVQRLVDGPPQRSPQRLLAWDSGTAAQQLASALAQHLPLA